MKIEIEGFAEAQFLGALTAEVAEKMHDQIEKAIDDGIRPALEEALEKITVEALRPAVAAAFEEGWQPTDGYGRPSGPKLTLRDRISQVFERKESYDHCSKVERIAREIIEAAYKADLNGEIAKLKEGFRKQVDEALQVKFRDAMAEAVGIKRG
jgi:hypothetical protein